MRDFLYTLILLGSVQGVIVCGLLLFSRGRLLSNRLLAAIIGLMTLPGFHLYLHYKGGYDINDFTRFVHDIMPMVVIMPVGPLIWFYVRSLTEPAFELGKKQRLHFLPLIIDLLPKLAAIIFYVTVWMGVSTATRDDYRQLDDWYNRYADIPRWLSVTFYLILAERHLKRYRETSLQSGKKIRQWLRLFTGLFAGFQLVWLIYLIPYVIPAYTQGLLKAVDWFPIYIPMTILVYWLGIQGYLTSLKLTIPKKAVESGWVDNAWQRLSLSMEQDRLYLDPELNLEKVAGHTGLTTRQISELLNQHRSTSFTAFVNHYRVEEFKTRLTGDTANQFTMAGLAMKCGFNSPATFQRIFKQYTGMAPSAFLKMTEKVEGEKKK